MGSYCFDCKITTNSPNLKSLKFGNLILSATGMIAICGDIIYYSVVLAMHHENPSYKNFMRKGLNYAHMTRKKWKK